MRCDGQVALQVFFLRASRAVYMVVAYLLRSMCVLTVVFTPDTWRPTRALPT